MQSQKAFCFIFWFGTLVLGLLLTNGIKNCIGLKYQKGIMVLNIFK